ncbi:MAG: hypothetical protein HGA78_06095 [Nitrospirales bacterium]|nr:hypothetical protein [Nitrospirales bacterium]
MKGSSRLSMGAKLLAGFGLLITLLATVGVTAYWWMLESRRSHETLVEKNLENLYDLPSLRANLNAERMAVAVMLETDRSTWGPWEKELRDRPRSNEEIIRRLSLRFRSDPVKSEKLNELIALMTVFDETREKQSLPLIRGGRISDAKRLFFGDELDSYRRMKVILYDLEEREVSEARNMVGEVERNAHIYATSFSLLTVLAGLLSLALAVFMHRAVSAYVAELRQHRYHLEAMVRQRTAELEEANGRLQDLDRLKSMFIASMSHELRTPLNSIIGFAGIILQGMTGEINEEQRRQLIMVKNNAAHLLALVNDVIDISEIEAGKATLAFETFDLAALVREVAGSFAVAVQKKGIKMIVQAPERLLIETDKRRTRQILTNLVGNAVKFTDRGSIEISLEERDNGIEIAVTDTGIGITQEDMGRLFSSFAQIVTEGRPKEGSGLGLYLSRKIADLLGGSISVQSEPGKGSVFTLSLPSTQRRAAA